MMDSDLMSLGVRPVYPSTTRPAAKRRRNHWGQNFKNDLTLRGMSELREAMAQAIDWDGLGKTSRPELFQRIRDEIEKRRKLGQVILYVVDLHQALSSEPPTLEEKKGSRGRG